MRGAKPGGEQTVLFDDGRARGSNTEIREAPEMTLRGERLPSGSLILNEVNSSSSLEKKRRK